jgi:hypothetical protein
MSTTTKARFALLATARPNGIISSMVIGSVLL